MSITSQVTTFEDLYTDLLNRVRISTNVSASVDQAKRYINIALQDVHLGFDYKLPWCEDQFVLRTKAPYTVGTVTIPIGSSVLTGTSTLWDTNDVHGTKNVVAHGKFHIHGDSTIYKVDTVVNDTSVTLYNTFVGSSSIVNGTYTYFEDEYALTSAFLRPLDFSMFSPAMGISLISRSEFRRRYPVINVSGRPKVACIVDTTTTGSNLTPKRKVIFYPYPDKAYHIPYTYVTSFIAVTSAGAGLTSMVNNTDQPTMPVRYRHAIVWHALSHWYRDRKDDARAESAKGEYTDIMMRIVQDHDIATHTKMQIQPNIGSYAAAAKSPYRSMGGRRVYDLNNEFDSFKR